MITPFEYTSTFFEILTNTIKSENEKMKMLPTSMAEKKSKALEMTRYDFHFIKYEIYQVNDFYINFFPNFK